MAQQYAFMHSQSTQLCRQALEAGRGLNYALRMENPVLASNVTALRKHLKLKQEAFAEKIGVTQPNVSKWESRGVEPSSRALGRMAVLAGCSVDEFLDKLWSPAPSAGPCEGPPEGRIFAPANDDDVVDIIALDLALSMGPGTLIEEFIESEPVKMSLRLVQSITRTPSDRLRLVRGIGDSMEPTLRTEDRVMIDLNERALARIGGIYWIDHLGTHGLKRLRAAGPGRIRIMSDNPNEENFDVDAADVRIHGRAIWFARGL